MFHRGGQFVLQHELMSRWLAQPPPPAVLLEQRIIELEDLGLVDVEETPGQPSAVRQFAIMSLLRERPPFFVTMDRLMLQFRAVLEYRYRMPILSILEAYLLLRDADRPAH